jgi:hypothetical protein
MSDVKKPKSTKTDRTEDGKFKKKEIKHDPNAESARAKFGKDK